MAGIMGKKFGTPVGTLNLPRAHAQSLSSETAREHR